MNNSKIVAGSKKINTSDPKGITQQNIQYSDIYSEKKLSDSDSDSDSGQKYEENETETEYYAFSSDDKSSHDLETDSESNFSVSDTEEYATPIKREQNSSLLGMKLKKKTTGHYKILQEDNDFEDES